jgi:hypothetical protein
MSIVLREGPIKPVGLLADSAESGCCLSLATNMMQPIAPVATPRNEKNIASFGDVWNPRYLDPSMVTGSLSWSFRCKPLISSSGFGAVGKIFLRYQCSKDVP